MCNKETSEFQKSLLVITSHLLVIRGGWGVGGCIRTIWTVQFQLVITVLCTLIEFCELFYFRNTCTYQYDIFYRVFNKHGIRNLLLYFVYDSNIKTLFMKVETAPSIQCQIFCSTRQNFENGVAVKFHACFKNVKFLRYSVSNLYSALCEFQHLHYYYYYFCFIGVCTM